MRPCPPEKCNHNSLTTTNQFLTKTNMELQCEFSDHHRVNRHLKRVHNNKNISPCALTANLNTSNNHDYNHETIGFFFKHWLN